MAQERVSPRTKGARRRRVGSVVLAGVLGFAGLSVAGDASVTAASTEGCVWVYWPGGGTWVCPPPPKPSGGGGGGGGGAVVMSLYYPGVNGSEPPPPDITGWTNGVGTTTTATASVSNVDCAFVWSGRVWQVACPTTLDATASITVAERAPT